MSPAAAAGRHRSRHSDAGAGGSCYWPRPEKGERSTAHFAPFRAATIAGSPAPAPSSRTLLPRTSAGWHSKWSARTRAAFHTRCPWGGMGADQSPRVCVWGHARAALSHPDVTAEQQASANQRYPERAAPRRDELDELPLVGACARAAIARAPRRRRRLEERLGLLEQPAQGVRRRVPRVRAPAPQPDTKRWRCTAVRRIRRPLQARYEQGKRHRGSPWEHVRPRGVPSR